MLMGVIGHLQNDSKNMSGPPRIRVFIESEKLSHLYQGLDSTVKTVLTCKSVACFLGHITQAGPPVFCIFFPDITPHHSAPCRPGCQLNLRLTSSTVTLFIPSCDISKAVKVFMGVQMRDSQSKLNL